ncbi:MAG: ribonuclease H-like domain-containing protein [Acidobacteria bacterium]|nr:ribonuclease H-like domain-containing protein [Acidobacteriota bacterium]
MSALRDRLRAVVGRAAPHPSGMAPAAQAPAADRGVAAGIDAALGGAWRGDQSGRCYVVERRCDPSARHGRETVGALAARFQAAAGDAPLLCGGAAARPPFVFLDLETTGLSGGAGTHAFLVGCGAFADDGGFVTRQFLLTRAGDERAVLAATAEELAGAGALVTFNGKSFDAPLLETRYLFHRLRWPAGTVPHVDVLHPARRFWGASPLRAAWAGTRARGAGPAQAPRACSLGELEHGVLGARRTGDVAGCEIPGRYFAFVREGDARPLAPVLEHNRLDLLSLAALTARMLCLLRRGPAAARDAQEMLALGRIYARGGLDAPARQAFEAAASAGGGALRVEALRQLALAWRRARRHEDAASCWRALLDARGCPPHLAAEAMEALAVHHEHRTRDLAAARALALGSLGRGAQAAALQHRLARLDRKMERSGCRPER